MTFNYHTYSFHKQHKIHFHMTACCIRLQVTESESVSRQKDTSVQLLCGLKSPDFHKSFSAHAETRPLKWMSAYHHHADWPTTHHVKSSN